MTRVFITEARVITALGRGLDRLYRRLLDGKRGFSKVDRFDTTPYVSSHAGLIPDLYSPIATETSAVITLAEKLMEDPWQMDRTGLLITASTKAGIDLMEQGSEFPVSGLPGRLARELGLERPGFNINAACASSTIAIAKAADLISRGREKTVFIIALDLVSEFVFSGFSAIGAMAPDPARPFDKNRQGLTLGEGAAFLALTNEESLKDRPALAELKGWGIAGDAAHLTAPDRNATGLKSAVVKACKIGNTAPEKIRAINTHGTGTVYNDAMELTAIHELFPDTVMANSIKGSVGHTLGAAGAIETALCIKLLEKRILPGTTGLNTPVQGAAPLFSTQNREFEKGPVLTTNSGFGGINAALILGDVQ